jgi:hypothetical protein
VGQASTLRASSRARFVPLGIALDQALRRLGQEAGFLLDQQQLAGGADDGEVDLAGDREALWATRVQCTPW